MSAEAVPDTVNTDLSQLPTYYNSYAIMQKYIVNDQRIPKRVTADGNCFFNAVSLSLYGHEHYSVQIRVRTCIQMCLNIHLDHDGRVRRHGITITTNYPPINGASDFVYKVLNTDFTPSNLKPKSNVTVLWTNTTTDPSKPITGTWTPSHFVLLATAQAIPPPSPTAQAIPPPSPTAQAIPPPSPPAQAIPPPSPEPEPDVNDISDQPEEISSDQTVNIDDTNDDEMMQSVDCNTDNDVYQADNDGQKMHPLPNNVLNASELYSIVTSDKPTFTSIPMGQKNNCYMLLDISTNVERKKSNKKSQFSDDLGSWNSDSGTTVNTHYVISHDFKCAYMKNGLYCFPKKVNNKRTFIPISPQPAESDVVTLYKYYTTLKR